MSFNLLRRHVHSGTVGGLIVLGFVLLAIFGPYLTEDPYKHDLARMLAGPDADRWCGSDELGRNLCARVIYGTRYALIEGIVPVALALVFGVPLGVCAGFFGGRIDMVVSWITDILISFPGVVLAIIVISVLGPGLTNALIAVAFYSLPIFIRMARSATMVQAGRPYIESLEALGASPARILFRHVLPNIASELSVIAALRVSISMLTVAGLSFLGLAAQPPTPEWGAMLAVGKNYVLITPHVVLIPGLAVVGLLMGFNLLQDHLRDRFDPVGGGR